MNGSQHINHKISIVIVDDHILLRDALAKILSEESDFEVIGQGGSAEEAARLARTLLPDIILLDIDMPGSGIIAAREITKDCPATKIVILTSSEDDDDLIETLKTNARAYILKGVPARELLRILRAVEIGERYVPPALAVNLLVEMHEPIHKQPKSPFDELTERERQILDELASGYSNKEIGQKLFLAEKTVKHYITNILQKLQVRNRVEAALLAQKKRIKDQ